MSLTWKRRRPVPEIRLLPLNPRPGEPGEFRVLKPEAVIGSGEDNQFVIRRPSVSSRHASLAFRKDRYEISDLDSTNGTFVNGRRIKGPTAIRLGDEIRLGDASFILGKPADAAVTGSKRKRVFPAKVLTRRGAIEVALLAFAIGFGVAQCLAYLVYRAQNDLILAEAVPVRPASNIPASAATRNQPAGQPVSSKAATRSVALPRVAARAMTPPSAKVADAVAIGAKELAGGIALARLIATSGTEAGRMAPNFALPALDETEASLSAMRGKVVLLNFWATWCGACRSEMPSLESLYRDFSSYPDFGVLTVSIDQRGRPAVTQFMAANGYNFPVLLDISNATSAAYGVSGIPSTFVIGRNGQIIWNCVGALDWLNQSMRDALKKLL